MPWKLVIKCLTFVFHCLYSKPCIIISTPPKNTLCAAISRKNCDDSYFNYHELLSPNKFNYFLRRTLIYCREIRKYSCAYESKGLFSESTVNFQNTLFKQGKKMKELAVWEKKVLWSCLFNTNSPDIESILVEWKICNYYYYNNIYSCRNNLNMSPSDSSKSLRVRGIGKQRHQNPACGRKMNYIHGDINHNNEE